MMPGYCHKFCINDRLHYLADKSAGNWDQIGMFICGYSAIIKEMMRGIILLMMKGKLFIRIP